MCLDFFLCISLRQWVKASGSISAEISPVVFTATAVEKWCVAGEGMKILWINYMVFGCVWVFHGSIPCFSGCNEPERQLTPSCCKWKHSKRFLEKKERKSTSQSYPYVRDISCWICTGSLSLIISCFFWSVASLQPSHATIGAPTLGRPSES